MRLLVIGPDLATSFPGTAQWSPPHVVTTTISKGENMKKLSIIALLVCGVSATAMAGLPTHEVPEPGTLGLLAAGVAGIVAAVRLGRRK